MDTFIKNMPLKAPGLAIHGAASALAKVSNTVATKIDGSIYPAVAAADLPALTTAFNLAANQAIALTVCLSKAGVYTYVASAIQTVPIKDALGNTITFPTGLMAGATFGTCVIGHIIIATDGTHTFTGGTTALDAAGITATYIDNFGYTGK